MIRSRSSNAADGRYNVGMHEIEHMFGPGNSQFNRDALSLDRSAAFAGNWFESRGPTVNVMHRCQGGGDNEAGGHRNRSDPKLVRGTEAPRPDELRIARPEALPESPN
jgi:hypothetical protein